MLSPSQIERLATHVLDALEKYPLADDDRDFWDLELDQASGTHPRVDYLAAAIDSDDILDQYYQEMMNDDTDGVVGCSVLEYLIRYYT